MASASAILALASACPLHARWTVGARPWLAPLIAAALIGAGSAALADGITLDSREYKLMLDPAKFTGAPQPIIDRFWNETLKPAIAERLDRRSGGQPRHTGNFALRAERTIVFRDTEAVRDSKACLLNAHAYSLRERARLKDGRRELTLKLRVPDIFLASQWKIRPATGDDVKFEEDIGPLVERRVTAAGEGHAAFVKPPTFRSLFSQSATQRITPKLSLHALIDVTALYPGLEAALRRAGVDERALAAPLVSGERFHERVFSGVRVDLDENIDAGFDLTLWYPAETAPPALAELSFKYDASDGVTDAVAWRALVLFRALQEKLGDWTSPERETKTSMALPKNCD